MSKYLQQAEQIIAKHPSCCIAVIAFSILVFCGKTSNGNFINPYEIVKRYGSFFYLEDRGYVQQGQKKRKKPLLKQMAIYWLTPFLFGISLAMVKLLDEDVAGVVLVVVTLICTVLFSMYSTFFSMMDKTSDNSEKSARIRIVLYETFDILNFEILLSIVLTALSFAAVICSSTVTKAGAIHFWSSAVMYSLLLMLFFNLMIILKRYTRLIKEL